jgi:hypothetical protein
MIVRTCFIREKRLDFSAQFGIAIAGFIKQRRALARFAFCDSVKQLLDLCPT